MEDDQNETDEEDENAYGVYNKQEAPQQQDSQEENEDDDVINETIYNNIMTSISKVWPTFDHTEGQIDLKEFENVMLNVAHDQNLYDGSQEEI